MMQQISRLAATVACLVTFGARDVVTAGIVDPANVDISLNLRYADPADPSEGGTWQLVAKTDSAYGIAAVNVYLSGVDLAGIEYGNGSTITASTIGAMTLPGGGVFSTPVVGGINLLYGQDTANGPVILNVGRGAGTPGNLDDDSLGNPAWDNVAALAIGTFGSNRPQFITAGANSSAANTLPGSSTTPPVNNSLAADVTTRVRGDSFLQLNLNDPADSGLLAGDATRDFVVNGDDLALLLLNYNTTGKSWGQGDFNDSADGAVNGDDLALVLLNYNKSSIPPASVAAATAVPEPATAALMGLAVVVAAARTRRRAPRD